jgi:hypothetical protein
MYEIRSHLKLESRYTKSKLNTNQGDPGENTQKAAAGFARDTPAARRAFVLPPW